MLRELLVHHAGVNGIIFSLGEKNGFGKLTLEGCDSDDSHMAKRLMSSLAQRTTHVPLTSALKRDSVGYLPLAVNYCEIDASAINMFPTLKKVVTRQYKKHVMYPIIGDTVTTRLIKVTPKGSLFYIEGSIFGGTGQPIAALAPLETPHGNFDKESTEEVMTEVRVLDYDVSSGAFIVTMDNDTVQKGHLNTLDTQIVVDGAAIDLNELSYKAQLKWTHSFQYLTVGSAVKAKVLLSLNGENVAVVEVYCGENRSVIGFVCEQQESIILRLGEIVDGVIVFCPKDITSTKLTPFVVLSLRHNRQKAISLPSWRNENALKSSSGLVGLFPWRSLILGIGSKTQRDVTDERDANNIRRRHLEEAIDAFERETDIIPTTPEGFKKLLLPNKNNSYIWTQYIAHHVKMQEIEQSRMVAEKALITIDPNETKELQNIWIAYMNLENLHGTVESLSAVFKRALQHSDNALTTHEKLADIFKKTKKHQQEMSICRVMVNKYRSNRRVWERLGIALLDHDKRDELKRMIKEMTGSSSILSKVNQFLVIEHIAIHEYRMGNVDSGRAMFEGLLLKAPKKADVWQVYLDKELSLLEKRDPLSSVSSSRQLFERITTVQFSPKVMQQFLTRFLTFEQTYGTPSDVENVKKKAQSYVENRLAVSQTL
eukprot:Tbor_TRINITY_DN2452_c0_g1::TRINITY_DN2452_c0_g1_i1::g.2561::m.2561/K14792/RRP5, PDCD11; rRNA biogenesis protein RRP5